MAEDTLAIQPTTPTPAPVAPTLLKMFRGDDTRANIVEVQAVAVVDENARVIQPMTDATGQQILAALVSINNILAASTGCGLPL